jgi:hypothetical protein
MHDCMHALLSVLGDTCVGTAGSLSLETLSNGAHVHRLVKESGSVVTPSLLATETTASARRCQGEPPLMRLCLRKNRTFRPLIL